MDDWTQLSDDECVMRMREALNDSQGYINFVINKKGQIVIYTGIHKLTDVQRMGLWALAKYQAEDFMEESVFRPSEMPPDVEI